MRRRSALVAAALLFMAAFEDSMAAEAFPSRPITLVMGISRGGIADTIARVYAQAASGLLGQPVVIDNRPSDSGNEAAYWARNAAPDGHTLLVFSGAQHFSVPLMQRVDYDALGDFAPVTTLFTLVNFLAVPASSPANSISDLMRLGREHGFLDYGSSGLGSTSHLTAILMTLATGVRIVPSHYAGAAPMIVDLAAHRLDFALASQTVLKPYLADGQLKLLAVDANERWPELPELPTLLETGVTKVKAASWFGLAAPKGTPAATVQKIFAAFAAAGKDPRVIRALRDNGALSGLATPEEMGSLMAEEDKRVRALIAGPSR
jgi:tripartite-type tricarboxylate transporter receptor subunit TctC